MDVKMIDIDNCKKLIEYYRILTNQDMYRITFKDFISILSEAIVKPVTEDWEKDFDYLCNERCGTYDDIFNFFKQLIQQARAEEREKAKADERTRLYKEVLSSIIGTWEDYDIDKLNKILSVFKSEELQAIENKGGI